MFALIRKEFNTFFASAVGYLVIAIFLILNGLFLWVFKGQYNILDSGFADLSPFFQIAPWILLFLIPAVTMRSFAEEKKQGTLELLLTKPIQNWQLVLGKYLGSLSLIIIALLPSLLYCFTIYILGNPSGNFDVGSTFGSYIALLLLASLYTAIGIFSSTITNNQIIAFLISLFFCFLFYFGFSSISDYGLSETISHFFEQLGIRLHYERMSQGILDTRDICYFLSIILFFGVLTKIILQKSVNKSKIKPILIALTLVFILNSIGNRVYSRFDLTQDNRFTLSDATKSLILETPAPVVIDVLLKGDFPSEFRKLQSETKQLLEEFNALNSNIQYIFTNPLEEEALRTETINQLQQFGLTPMEVSVQESGKTEIETIVPWAILSYQNKSVKIPLVKNNIGATSEERVNSSIQQLEYAFADGLTKILHPKKHKIAVLKGNGQLPDLKIADFIKTLQEYYFVGAFTLDSVSSNATKTLEDLQKFDLIINAKPTQTFSEKEKYVLDQFIMNGGKSLWLLESVAIEIDSLMNPEGSTVALMRDLRLNDALFSYGVRVNPVLVNDLQSAPLVLASGQGNDTQFTPYPWFYESLTKSTSNHPIVKNIESVKFEFANQIDTIKNNIKKTILLTSSEKVKLEGVPKEIRLDIIREKPDFSTYIEGKQNLAVLLEGEFKSNYKDRIKPIKIKSPKDNSSHTKMIVVSDGDIIKNKTRKGQPLALGFDPYLNLKYGNKEFLLNAINYLLDDSGLIEVRSKEINIPFLNVEKVVAQKTKWQIINIIVPLVLLGIFGFLFSFIRKKKYKKVL
ncbi:gliding motility-associated ABC transporter substrate-binding protein GldG [Aquimarina sp. AD10]|uniref:Gliding motility protein GldG n=1 Tax=Aquimarina aggregata TaxID=1642818 RepID=A0A162XF51_9FLAO|nr:MULTISPECIES: gliding motility-associated ABC transporter substrate-binding protein GldG [Aquimarina]AXT60159.1 gliding motility-associated ABC transporter substrate-binding protein GldG [Aquimarina sp. AD10]KZS38597.1 gliding motility protein GldG [Aquimarina aggregata]RKN00047.1 gliding motility-associated ABC transporter substrate-binding protein GldG [Aquimarina sp. AD10]